MLETPAYAALTAKAPLKPHAISRREPGPHDVLIDILYCGVCHSDIHQARERVGPGDLPDGARPRDRRHRARPWAARWRSGRSATPSGSAASSTPAAPATPATTARSSTAQGWSFTYNGFERDGKTPTYGGYSTRITVDENYVLRIPAGLALDAAAPLLCAGITCYSPLRHWGVKAGDQVAIVGLGGLGHMGVKLAKAMGAHVTVLSHSAEEARRRRAPGRATTSSPPAKRTRSRRTRTRFDFILDTVSAAHDYNAYLGLLKRDETMVLVGVPDPTPLSAFPLVIARRRASRAR